MTEKTFIFKYDPGITPEKMFANLQQVWRGELRLVEPHIIKSNSIKALLHGLTEERLELFSTLVKKKPDNLTQLADCLNRDYEEVKKDSEILASWGVIELQGEKPTTLYEKITLEFPVYPTSAGSKKNIRSEFD